MGNKLTSFVQNIRTTPIPVAVVVGGTIVDGIGPGTWSAEDITAEAFNADIFGADVSWESALAQVQSAMTSTTTKAVTRTAEQLLEMTRKKAVASYEKAKGE